MIEEQKIIPSHRQEDKKKQKKNGWIGVSILAAIIAFGGGSWWLSGSASKDDLSTSEITQRQQSFEQAGSFQLEEVAPAELFKAYSAMNLKANEIKALEADIKHGTVKLAWITVWDNQAVDGDIINIQAGGFSSQISLTHEKQRMAIPINQGEVTITGIADGSGGITLGFYTTNGTVSLPVIAPGQTVVLPIKK